MVDSVERFISSPNNSSFGAIATRLFEFQYQHNTAYRNYCLALGRTPENTGSWTEIPAVPTNSFKFTDHPLTCGGDIKKIFLTSGTTTETKGAHHFPDTKLYEYSITRTWEHAGLPRLPTLFLAPSASESPQSSLSHMFAHLNSGGPEAFLLNNQRFNLVPLLRLVDSGDPIFLMGTALAFLHLLETQAPFPLPSGSRLLETGGYKGTANTLAKHAFYEQLSAHFNLPGDHLHNEYGMTELSTQAYATGPEGHHRFPPWCRHLIIDPESGQPAPAGQTGYLQLLDLANVHSVAAIRTQDFAIAQPDGSFELIGRDPGALPRGCSRTIDHALSS